MTNNSDNAMARFLFAILKQKNLKDIDWNKVASDPVLLEPITNGHAARMRYSRFRATVSGQPTVKRNRSADKVRGGKVKKESQGKKNRLIKSESGASLSSYAQFSPASTTTPSPYLADNVEDFDARFLTPCSDDMVRALSIHGSAVENMPLFPPANNGTTDFLNQAVHDHTSPNFSAFDAAFDLSGYGPAEVHSQGLSPSVGSQHLPDNAEDWADHVHEQQF